MPVTSPAQHFKVDIQDFRKFEYRVKAKKTKAGFPVNRRTGLWIQSKTCER
jgi:hypothetical protein